MANTPENLAKAREKARFSPNLGKHGKWEKTLLKEELREIFIELVGGRLNELLEILLKKALKEKDSRSLIYLIDQLIGKPESKGQNSSGLPNSVIPMVDVEATRKEYE